MRLTVKGRKYAKIFKDTVYTQLLTRLSKDEAKVIMGAVKKEYKAICLRADQMGGAGNYFIDNIFIAAYITALYKNIKYKFSVGQLEEMMVTAFNSESFLYKKLLKFDLVSDKYIEKMKRVEIWLDRHAEKYPDDYIIEVIETGEDNEICLKFAKCAMWNLSRNEGVPEIIPVLSKVEVLRYEMAGYNVITNGSANSGNGSWILYIKREELSEAAVLN